MRCPYCGGSDSKVIDSRAMEENSAIRRRRQCEGCGERFTTYERIDNITLIVTKRDGTREAFDRDKILNGIMLSCNKRPISLDQMQMIVTGIENAVLSSMNKEVPSHEIGDMVMEKLKDIDEVAYVRFASVYKQFKDIDTFMDELSSMLSEKRYK